MALVLTIANGDVVDIANSWIALLSIEGRKSATLIIDNGDKVSVSSKYKTEVLPTVWVQLGLRAGSRKLKLLIEAPKGLVIARRPQPQGITVFDASPLRGRPSQFQESPNSLK